MSSQKAAVAAGLGLMLSACDQPVPACSSEDVKNIVIKKVYVSTFVLDLLRYKDPELFKSVVKGTLEDIRERRFDKKTGKRWCTGQFRLQIDNAALPKEKSLTEFTQAIKAIGLLAGGPADQNYTVHRTPEGKLFVIVGD